MSDNLPTPRKGTAPAVRRQLADRTAKLLSRQEPEIRWRRQVTARSQVWVRLDGPLVIDGELFEIATGAPVAARRSAFPTVAPYGDSGLLRRPQVVLRSTGPVRPWPGVTAAPGNWRWCRLWQRLVVVGREEGPGRMQVAAFDPVTGATAWQHQPVGDDTTTWQRWFAELNGVTRLRHHDAWTAPLDPATRRPRWRVPRERLHGAAERRKATTTGEVLVVYDEKTHVFAGLDAADGTVRWSTEPMPDLATNFGLTGRHLVRLSYRSRHLADDEWMCDCYAQPATRRDKPDDCRTCGKPLPWMTVEVRDRISGDRLWTHRWPWTEPGDMVNGALAVRGEAVLTWEGGFLRARHLADGSPLWSLPHVSVRGGPAAPYGGQSHRFFDCGMASPRRWAWQQFVTFLDDGDEIDDVFIQAATGQVVRLAHVFHHTDDDLALTLTGNTLTCIALP